MSISSVNPTASAVNVPPAANDETGQPPNAFGVRLPGGGPLPLGEPNGEPAPFPVDALGPLLADAASGIADIVQAPLAMVGTSVLAAATLVVQGHANVRLPYGITRPVSNLFVSAGMTGDRKSAVDGLATAALQQYQDILWSEYEALMEAYEAERLAALKNGEPPPPTPRTPQFLMDDPNAEGIYRLLSEGQPSVGLFSDEGGRFLGGYAMSEDQRLKTATTLSLLWDGRPLTRVRGGERASYLPGRRFCANVMLQPYLLATILGDAMLKEQGLLSRTLITAPRSLMGTRPYRDPSPASEQAVERYTTHLLQLLVVPPRMARRPRNALDCRAMVFSAAAKAAWVVFHDEIEGHLKEGGQLRSIAGLAAKLAEHAARIAGVVALIEDIDAAEVDERHIEAGVALARHFAREARRLFAEPGADPELALARKVGAWLLQRCEANQQQRLSRLSEQGADLPEGARQLLDEDRVVPLADLYQLGPKGARHAATARRMMDILERHRWVVRVPGTHEVRGVKAGELYYVVAHEGR